MLAKCPKCENTGVTYTSTNIGGKTRLLVCCRSCGVIVGVVDQ